MGRVTYPRLNDASSLNPLPLTGIQNDTPSSPSPVEDIMEIAPPLEGAAWLLLRLTRSREQTCGRTRSLRTSYASKPRPVGLVGDLQVGPGSLLVSVVCDSAESWHRPNCTCQAGRLLCGYVSRGIGRGVPGAQCAVTETRPKKVPQPAFSSGNWCRAPRFARSGPPSEGRSIAVGERNEK